MSPARALVEAGPNRELPDRKDKTALQLARERGFVEMLKVLESAPKR